MEFAYRTFYIDESVDKFNQVEQTVKDYGIEQYLIAHEQYNRKGQDKPHFHFLVFTTLKNLRALVKHFTEKYNLANKDGKRGGYRKYGTHADGKPIVDETKFATYLCKDGNVRSTFPEEQLLQYKQNSYKSEEKFFDKEKLIKEIKFIQQQVTPLSPSTNQFGAVVIDYKGYERKIVKLMIKVILRDELKIAFNKNTLRNIFIEYLKEVKHPQASDIIFDILF